MIYFSTMTTKGDFNKEQRAMRLRQEAPAQRGNQQQQESRRQQDQIRAQEARDREWQERQMQSDHSLAGRNNQAVARKKQVASVAKNMAAKKAKQVATKAAARWLMTAVISALVAILPYLAIGAACLVVFVLVWTLMDDPLGFLREIYALLGEYTLKGLWDFAKAVI